MRLLGHVSFKVDKKNAYWYLVGNDEDHLEEQGEDARRVLIFIFKK
jgi:hypothetical protein